MAGEKKTGALGEVVKAKAVQRPDGTDVTVSDGLYVLSQPGTYVIDGTELEVK